MYVPLELPYVTCLAFATVPWANANNIMYDNFIRTNNVFKPGRPNKQCIPQMHAKKYPSIHLSICHHPFKTVDHDAAYTQDDSASESLCIHVQKKKVNLTKCFALFSCNVSWNTENRGQNIKRCDFTTGLSICNQLILTNDLSASNLSFLSSSPGPLHPLLFRPPTQSSWSLLSMNLLFSLQTSERRHYRISALHASEPSQSELLRFSLSNICRAHSFSIPSILLTAKEKSTF